MTREGNWDRAEKKKEGAGARGILTRERERHRTEKEPMNRRKNRCKGKWGQWGRKEDQKKRRSMFQVEPEAFVGGSGQKKRIRNH